MTSARRGLLLALIAGVCAQACAQAGDEPPGGGTVADAAPTVDDNADAHVPPPLCGIPVDGPAAALLIDDAVHPGGVWNEPMDFRLSDYPLTWAIATVHASMLLRSRCIEYSPNAVLSHAIKESRLQCALPGSLSGGDGCFQIESTSAYTELGRMFPGRFLASHADVISGDHFETSALTLVHYFLFSRAMFRKYTACPDAFFTAHPDPRTPQKVLAGAYNRGLWWNALPAIFATCADRDVMECFDPGVVIDYTNAIVDYTTGLTAAPPFDAPVRWDDVVAYWERIRVLYPEADAAAVLAVTKSAFDAARGTADSIGFHQQIRCVLGALIAALPALPTIDDAAAAACTWSYLMGDACLPAGGVCPAGEACVPDSIE